MSIQAAKEELNSLTEFQRDIHLMSNMSEEIISNFYRAFIKSTWYSSIPMKLKCSEDGEEVIYSVNNSFHLLMYSYMCFNLPAVKVKPEYKNSVRIAWCHNIGTNHIKQAIFKEDDDTYHTWDSCWADIYFQFYQDGGAGKRENHNIGIGNVKCLEDWTDFLPSYPINVEQPWFYSMDHALSFPIFYKNSQTRAEHRYTFRRKLTDLLRVQALGRDGKWKNTVNKVHKYLDITASTTLKLPELWGRYAYITEPEIKWYKCKPVRTFYTRDIEVCDTANPNKYGSKAQIDLHCTNPCLAFFWVAENLDATASHNYSNYTTDINDLYSGWDPVRNSSLIYGTTVRLNNMPSHHFSIAEPRKHFPSAPSERGYHAYSFAWDSTSYHGDIGIVFAKMNAKLQCSIENNDIFNNIAYDEDEEDETDELDKESDDGHLIARKNDIIDPIHLEDPSPNFVTRVRLLVVRKFTITPDIDDKYKFTIR